MDETIDDVTTAAPIGLTIRQAVELSGLGRSTIYEELAAGRLSARKLGRRTIILREDLEQWLLSLPAMKRAGGDS